MNPFDPQVVFAAQVKRNKENAMARNAAAVEAYKNKCETWKAVNARNRDLGVPIAPYPVIPLKEVVSDNNDTTWEQFPDLKPPVLPDPEPSNSSGKIAVPSGPPDTKVIIAALAEIGETLNKIAVACGVK